VLVNTLRYVTILKTPCVAEYVYITVYPPGGPRPPCSTYRRKSVLIVALRTSTRLKSVDSEVFL